MMFDTMSSLLNEKKNGATLVSVTSSGVVVDAVRAMNAANVGAILVMDGSKLAGIFTERDVLVRVVGAGRDPTSTLVSEVMTATVRSVKLTTTVEDALQLMSSKRHRHLPVLEDGRVHGMVSMGDVTRWVIRSQQERVNLAIGAVKQMGMSNRRR